MKLMIKFNVGVSVDHVYEVKRIDIFVSGMLPAQQTSETQKNVPDRNRLDT